MQKAAQRVIHFYYVLVITYSGASNHTVHHSSFLILLQNLICTT